MMKRSCSTINSSKNRNVISGANSNQLSNEISQRKKKDLSKQDQIYSVVKFIAENDDDETYSVIPTFWLQQDEKYTLWPKKDMRNCIIKRKEPYKDWALHPVTVVAKYDSYDKALNKEKRLMEKSTTESEVDLGRGLRKKKRKKNDDYCSDSSEEEQEASDNDSIPEYESPSDEQNANDVDVNDVDANDVDANDVDVNDVNVNENIGGAGVRIVDLNNIPVVIEGQNYNAPRYNYDIGTLDSVLRYVLEIKGLCKRIDDRLNRMENTNNVNVNHNNIDMLPQLPMDNIEDIDNFEIILASAEAQSQLVNMLVMIGGTTTKDAMKRALQKLFTNNLASKCSWTGAKNNFKLKELKIIICMKASIKKTCPSITEAEFEDILKTWFRQANLRLLRENARKNVINNT